VLFVDLETCLCTSQLQILNPMSDLNFTVSLKASPFPYGIVALAQFVDVPVAYEENIKDDLALVRNGVFVTDPAEITSALASQGAPGGESSKVHVIHQVQGGEADVRLADPRIIGEGKRVANVYWLPGRSGHLQ